MTKTYEVTFRSEIEADNEDEARKIAEREIRKGYAVLDVEEVEE